MSDSEDYVAEPSEPTAVTVANPFRAPAVRQDRPTAMADVVIHAELARVKAQMVIAQQFPRNPVESVDRILNACTRPSLAEVALYSYSRGGTEITGPSIRLAEVLAQNWRNLDFGVRELERRGVESVAESYCWDVEGNVRQSRIFTVRHERHTRKGVTRLTDERDIYENLANLGARRMRSCVLAIIPGDVVELAVRQCEETQRANVDLSPDAIRKMVEAFAEFGVTSAQIAARCQCHVEAIRPAQMVQLRKVYQSLRDGIGAPADFFPPAASGGEQDAATKDRSAALAARLSDQAAKNGTQEQAPAADAPAKPAGGENAPPEPAGEGDQTIRVGSPPTSEPAADAASQPSQTGSAAAPQARTLTDDEWVDGEFRDALLGACQDNGQINYLLGNQAIVRAKQRRFREHGRGDLLARMADLVAARREALSVG